MRRDKVPALGGHLFQLGDISKRRLGRQMLGTDTAAVGGPSWPSPEGGAAEAPLSVTHGFVFVPSVVMAPHLWTSQGQILPLFQSYLGVTQEPPASPTSMTPSLSKILKGSHFFSISSSVPLPTSGSTKSGTIVKSHVKWRS